ncbi:MAG: two-component system, NtrC family, nitrogen regulation response regulator NtrX, partial [Candidatus Hydrogenedentes bacterium]|nr:two-component system, NtrC family, nitrogen regulation response regulator NtrX [Candidatus Hydrogenedentota bacterium]
MAVQRRILVVDDEAGMRELLEIVLGNDGYEVVTAPDVATACKTLEEQTFDCVLTDLRMGNEREAGMRVLSWLRDNDPNTPAVMITAHGSVESAIEAMKRGAADYLMKPFKNDDIKLLVKRAIEHR